MDTANKNPAPEVTGVTPTPQPIVSAPDAGSTGKRPARFSHEVFRVLLIIAGIADLVIGGFVLYLFAGSTGEMGGLIFFLGMIVAIVLGTPAALVTALIAIGYAKTEPARIPTGQAPTRTIQPTISDKTAPPADPQ